MMSIRLDPKQKKKIKKYKINWSEYLRKCLDEKIREEEMKEAARKMDELAEGTTGTWSGAAEIRRWRDESRVTNSAGS